MITRNQALKVIHAGGSVLIHEFNDGRPIARLEDLPSQAEFAKHSGDAGQVSEAQKSLQAQVAAMQAELDALKAGTAGAKTTAPSLTLENTANTVTDTETDDQKRYRAALERMSEKSLKDEAKDRSVTIPAEMKDRAEIITYLVAQHTSA